jgi:hypothetical protein
MNRRAIVAGLLALLPLHASAQRDPFPLAPKPNPSTTCAKPLERKVGIPAPRTLLDDLLLWQYEHPYVKTAYVAVHESQVSQVPIGSIAMINGTTFTLTVMAQGVMPDDAKWMIMADCGTPL